MWPHERRSSFGAGVAVKGSGERPLRAPVGQLTVWPLMRKSILAVPGCVHSLPSGRERQRLMYLATLLTRICRWVWRTRGVLVVIQWMRSCYVCVAASCAGKRPVNHVRLCSEFYFPLFAFCCLPALPPSLVFVFLLVVRLSSCLLPAAAAFERLVHVSLLFVVLRGQSVEQLCLLVVRVCPASKLTQA